jgi:hypothetical protein
LIQVARVKNIVALGDYSLLSFGRCATSRNLLAAEGGKSICYWLTVLPEKCKGFSVAAIPIV